MGLGKSSYKDLLGTRLASEAGPQIEKAPSALRGFLERSTKGADTSTSITPEILLQFLRQKQEAEQQPSADTP